MKCEIKSDGIYLDGKRIDGVLEYHLEQGEVYYQDGEICPEIKKKAELEMKLIVEFPDPEGV